MIGTTILGQAVNSLAVLFQVLYLMPSVILGQSVNSSFVCTSAGSLVVGLILGITTPETLKVLEEYDAAAGR